MNSSYRRARTALLCVGAGIRTRSPFAMARIGKWGFVRRKPRRPLHRLDSSFSNRGGFDGRRPWGSWRRWREAARTIYPGLWAPAAALRGRVPAPEAAPARPAGPGEPPKLAAFDWPRATFPFPVLVGLSSPFGHHSARLRLQPTRRADGPGFVEAEGWFLAAESSC